MIKKCVCEQKRNDWHSLCVKMAFLVSECAVIRQKKNGRRAWKREQNQKIIQHCRFEKCSSKYLRWLKMQKLFVDTVACFCRQPISFDWSIQHFFKHTKETCVCALLSNWIVYWQRMEHLNFATFPSFGEKQATKNEKGKKDGTACNVITTFTSIICHDCLTWFWVDFRC